MDWVFLGPPGCGKGTQAQVIQSKGTAGQFSVVCTGELLRQEMRDKTEIGQKITAIMNAGILVDDVTVSEVTAYGIARNKSAQHIVFDGYPRSIRQAQDLNLMLGACDRQLGGVLSFRVDEELLIERITGRFMCASCGSVYHEQYKKPLKDGICDACGATEFLKRNDDDAKVLRNRLLQYQEKTQPIYEYYAQRDLLREVDASQSVEQVHKQLLMYMKVNI